jgi:hypothetical protein
MDTLQGYLNTLNFNLQQTLANPYVASLLLIFFIMYAGLAAPNLPAPIARLFDFTVFKILVLALILYINNFSPQIAIVVAVGFFLSLQTLSRSKVFDLAGEITRVKRLIGLKNGNGNGDDDDEDTDSEGGVDEVAHYGLDDTDTQVSGLAARTPFYQGPQGMKHPMGFGGDLEGADTNF